MRTKYHSKVAKAHRLTQPAPSLVRMRKAECHRWLSKSRGMQYIQKARVYKLARVSGMLGESIASLAERVGVPSRILGQWMMKDPKIQRNMQKGMDVMVVEVERAAIKRAVGYDKPKRTISTKRDISGKVVERTTVSTVEHIAGDPSMQRYILDRRAKKRYAKEDNAPAQVLIHIDGDDDRL